MPQGLVIYLALTERFPGLSVVKSAHLCRFAERHPRHCMRIGTDRAPLSLTNEKFPTLDKLIEGVPLVIVEDGKPLKERMQRARINESDVLVAAPELQGLERLDQIRYAVLERTGEISIIPKRRQD